MPPNDVVRELANSGRSEAAKLAKNAARNPAVRKATGVVVTAVAKVVTTEVTEALFTALKSRSAPTSWSAS